MQLYTLSKYKVGNTISGVKVICRRIMSLCQFQKNCILRLNSWRNIIFRADKNITIITEMIGGISNYGQNLDWAANQIAGGIKKNTYYFEVSRHVK